MPDLYGRRCVFSVLGRRGQFARGLGDSILPRGTSGGHPHGATVRRRWRLSEIGGGRAGDIGGASCEAKENDAPVTSVREHDRCVTSREESALLRRISAPVLTPSSVPQQHATSNVPWDLEKEKTNES